MSDRFEAGKTYLWADPCFDPFTVVSRTEKTILVTNNVITWRMRIRHDDAGEYVKDSSMDRSPYKNCPFTSRPRLIVR